MVQGGGEEGGGSRKRFLVFDFLFSYLGINLLLLQYIHNPHGIGCISIGMTECIPIDTITGSGFFYKDVMKYNPSVLGSLCKSIFG